MRRMPAFTVDAFCDTPFGGNPAGVIPRAVGLSDAEMQRIAREMRHSETAFVLPPEEPESHDLRVRFFTPTTEVDLCGHATIATFHLMAERGWLPSLGPRTTVRVETKAGPISVEVEWAGRDIPERSIRRVMMTQIRPRFLGTLPEARREELAEALGAAPEALGVLRRRSARGGEEGAASALQRVPVAIVSTGIPDLLVPVADLRALAELAPDPEALARFSRLQGVGTVHAYTLETRERRNAAACRSFSPALGVPEESATGTASGALGAFLVRSRLVPLPGGRSENVVDMAQAAARVQGGTGRGLRASAPASGARGEERVVSLRLEQGDDMGRPSRIDVEVTTRSGRVAGVRVGGRAVTVFEGNLVLGHP